MAFGLTLHILSFWLRQKTVVIISTKSISLPDLPKVPKTPVRDLKSTSTALIPIGSTISTGSTVGINYNNHVRNIAIFPKHIVSQLVGHLLGDGALVMT